MLEFCYMNCEGGDHYNGRLGLRIDVCLPAKVRECGIGLRRWMNADPLTHSSDRRHMRLRRHVSAEPLSLPFTFFSNHNGKLSTHLFTGSKMCRATDYDQ